MSAISPGASATATGCWPRSSTAWRPRPPGRSWRRSRRGPTTLTPKARAAIDTFVRLLAEDPAARPRDAGRVAQQRGAVQTSRGGVPLVRGADQRVETSSFFAPTPSRRSTPSSRRWPSSAVSRNWSSGGSTARSRSRASASWTTAPSSSSRRRTSRRVDDGPRSRRPSAAVALAAGGGSTDARLSADQLVGQRLVVGFAGTEVPDTVRSDGPPPASWPASSCSTRTFETRDEAAAPGRRPALDPPAGPRHREPLLVMVDQEGGEVKRLPGPPDLSAAADGRRRGLRTCGRAGRRDRRDGCAASASTPAWRRCSTLRAPGLGDGRRGKIVRAPTRRWSARCAEAFAGRPRAARRRPDGEALPGPRRRDRGDTDVGVQRIEASRGAPAARRRGAVPDVRVRRRRRGRLVMLSSAVYPAFGDRPASLEAGARHRRAAGPTRLSRRVDDRRARGHRGVRRAGTDRGDGRRAPTRDLLVFTSERRRRDRGEAPAGPPRRGALAPTLRDRGRARAPSAGPPRRRLRSSRWI